MMLCRSWLRLFPKLDICFSQRPHSIISNLKVYMHTNKIYAQKQVNMKKKFQEKIKQKMNQNNQAQAIQLIMDSLNKMYPAISMHELKRLPLTKDNIKSIADELLHKFIHQAYFNTEEIRKIILEAYFDQLQLLIRSIKFQENQQSFQLTAIYLMVYELKANSNIKKNMQSADMQRLINTTNLKNLQRTNIFMLYFIGCQLQLPVKDLFAKVKEQLKLMQLVSEKDLRTFTYVLISTIRVQLVDEITSFLNKQIEVYSRVMVCNQAFDQNLILEVVRYLYFSLFYFNLDHSYIKLDQALIQTLSKQTSLDYKYRCLKLASFFKSLERWFLNDLTVNIQDYLVMIALGYHVKPLIYLYYVNKKSVEKRIIQAIKDKFILDMQIYSKDVQNNECFRQLRISVQIFMKNKSLISGQVLQRVKFSINKIWDHMQSTNNLQGMKLIMNLYLTQIKYERQKAIQYLQKVNEKANKDEILIRINLQFLKVIQNKPIQKLCYQFCELDFQNGMSKFHLNKSYEMSFYLELTQLLMFYLKKSEENQVRLIFQKYFKTMFFQFILRRNYGAFALLKYIYFFSKFMPDDPNILKDLENVIIIIFGQDKNIEQQSLAYFIECLKVFKHRLPNLEELMEEALVDMSKKSIVILKYAIRHQINISVRPKIMYIK